MQIKIDLEKKYFLPKIKIKGEVSINFFGSSIVKPIVVKKILAVLKEQKIEGTVIIDGKEYILKHDDDNINT